MIVTGHLETAQDHLSAAFRELDDALGGADLDPDVRVPLLQLRDHSGEVARRLGALGAFLGLDDDPGPEAT